MAGNSGLTQYNGYSYTMKQELSSGSNSHASEAFNNILNQCIYDGWKTGTWESDGQWYWIQIYSGCLYEG
jgi:hypothetical protein